MRISARLSRSPVAFTLIEVTIAIAIFFVAVFAILDLVMQSVRAAHSLNQMGPTAGMVAAELSLSNKLEAGAFSGDFGDLYPDYSWTQDISLWGTNGMFQADIMVLKGHNVDSSMSILLYRPDSEQHVGDAAGKMVFSGKGQKGPASNSRNSGFNSGNGGLNSRNNGFRGGRGP